MPNPRTFHLPDLTLREHWFEVPLNHEQPGGARIPIFAREAVAPARELEALPWMVFFQGGPGFGAPRPMGAGTWLKRAIQDYRVLLLDQRGTGRSSPINTQSLARFETPQEQADYLALFRADSIVADAEIIRKSLVGQHGQWTAFGQSYGGWCISSYLSTAPKGLKAALFTGGIPPLQRTAEEVYRETFKVVEEKNHQFYHRYPEDRQRVAAIADFLDANEVLLPRGGRMDARWLQQLGAALGGSTGMETLHYMIEDAFVDGAQGPEINHAFLAGIEQQLPFDTNPIYAILHEAIYAQGEATRWAADRVQQELPQFDPGRRDPFLFTGEMIYPWMFESSPRLRPLKDAAEILAAKQDWPPLYDLNVLGQNEVPCAACVYANDMYVVREYSEESASRIPHMDLWVTSHYEHNGIHVDGAKIMDQLMGMLE